MNELLDPLAYRPTDAARVLGVSRPTIFKLLAAGKLERVKFGPRLVLIPRSSIEGFLKSGAAR